MPKNTKLRKITLYVLDINNEMSDEELRYHLESHRYVEFAKVGKLETTHVGEWHDDHPLNKRGADYDAYFREEETPRSGAV